MISENKSTPLLCHYNRKYGTEIFSFTLPKSTCIYKTPHCDKFCYGNNKYPFNFTNVKEKYEQNYLESLNDGFVSVIVQEIHDKQIKWIRIHAIGDYYSQEYFDKWVKITRECPESRFMCYTRNYQLNIPEDLPNNFVIYFSIDDSTEQTHPNIKRIARAFKAPPEIHKYKHLEPSEHGLICSNICANCKVCWNGKIDKIAFPITNGSKTYKDIHLPYNWNSPNSKKPNKKKQIIISENRVIKDKMKKEKKTIERESKSEGENKMTETGTEAETNVKTEKEKKRMESFSPSQEILKNQILEKLNSEDMDRDQLVNCLSTPRTTIYDVLEKLIYQNVLTTKEKEKSGRRGRPKILFTLKDKNVI